MVCWAVLSIGHMELTPIEFLGVASLSIAGFVFLALLILIEWNLTLEDPDMAVAQMIWALTVVVLTSHFAVELKPVVLMSGLAMVVMGANRLKRQQLFVVAAYGLFLYMVSVMQLTSESGMSAVTELVIVFAFGLVLVFGPALYQFERTIFENLMTDKNDELTRALAQIKDMAVRDELTGVYNRRHVMEMLGQQKGMAERSSYAFSICYVDLDYFKKVNDRFGHATGDEVLKNFARVAEEILREVDCVARIGGEEFVLVMSGTNQHDAVTGAQRIADALKDMHVTRNEPRYRITASVGITQYRAGDTVERMLERADSALYEAKRTGRNKIVVAEDEHGASPVLRAGSRA